MHSCSLPLPPLMNLLSKSCILLTLQSTALCLPALWTQKNKNKTVLSLFHIGGEISSALIFPGSYLLSLAMSRSSGKV